ncbi:hypothetical protein BKN14_00370 [Candidatus Gracilibacteria bacterium HOT-871]|nr:hypothetical protein BKN14_00370 [Candidatus Gracilibacteria bacterium HOT-871]
MNGGKSKFKKKFIKELEEYFNVSSNFILEETIEGTSYTKIKPTEFASNLPTIQGFCYKIGIHRDTFYEWLKQAEDKEYTKNDKEDKKKLSDTYKKAKENQENIWLQNSLKGLYSPAFAIFLGKNVFGYKDKTETESAIEIKIENKQLLDSLIEE